MTDVANKSEVVYIFLALVFADYDQIANTININVEEI